MGFTRTRNIKIIPTLSGDIVDYIKVTTATPVSGIVNVTQFPLLTSFIFNDQNVTNITGLQNLTKLNYLSLSGNRYFGSYIGSVVTGNPFYVNINNTNVFGNLDILYGKTLLQEFYANNTQIAGSAILPQNIVNFSCVNSKLSGNIIIPSIGYSSLKTFNISKNNLVGSIPEITPCPSLQYFNCSDNKINKFGFSSGVPSELTYFNASNNIASLDDIVLCLQSFANQKQVYNTQGSIILSGTNMPALSDYTIGYKNYVIRSLVQELTSGDNSWNIVLGSKTIKESAASQKLASVAYNSDPDLIKWISKYQNQAQKTISQETLSTLNQRVSTLKINGFWDRYKLNLSLYQPLVIQNVYDDYIGLTKANINEAATVSFDETVVGRLETLWFIQSLSASGMWNDTICWPMRRYLNNNSDPVVIYPLGGYLYNPNIAFDNTSSGAVAVTDLPLTPVKNNKGINFYKLSEFPLRVPKLSSVNDSFGAFMMLYNSARPAGVFMSQGDSSRDLPFWSVSNGSTTGSIRSLQLGLSGLVNSSLYSIQDTFIGPDESKGFYYYATEVTPTSTVQIVDGGVRSQADIETNGFSKQRTNLITNSTRIDRLDAQGNATDWFFSGQATTAINSTLAPDDTNTGTTLFERDGQLFCGVGQVIAPPVYDIGDITYDPITFSVFLKSYTRGYALIDIYNDNGTDLIAIVNLVDGIIETVYTQDTNNQEPTIIDANITAYPNDWYRVRITGISSTKQRPIINYTPTTATVRIFSQLYNDGSIYPGSTPDGIFIWGPQFEISRYASNYTPTQDAAIIGDTVNAPFRIGGNSDTPPNMANATISLAGYVNNLYSNTLNGTPIVRLNTLYTILTSTIGYGLN
jgi:hypothetical protein